MRIVLDRSKVYDQFLKKLDFSTFLTELIVKKVELKNGTFFVDLPKGFLVDNLYSLDSDIIVQGPETHGKIEIEGRIHDAVFKVDTVDNLEAFILDYLKKSEDSFVLFDDIVTAKKDKHVAVPGVKTCYQGDSVYHLLQYTNTSAEIRKTILNCFHNWFFLAIFFKGTPVFTDAFIKSNKNLLAKPDYIVVGGYDGQSFIYWERDKGPS